MSKIKVNGQEHTVLAGSQTSLLEVLQNELMLKGPKYGCGLAQCGACTVHINGQAIRSCVMPVGSVRGQVTTLEGLGTADHPHPVQKAFIEAQAAQCGYCINGMVMTTVAFLKKTPKPSDEQIMEALDGNLCRCGTHMRILSAVRKASGRAV
ncbi:MAG: (2Fe-2S)-binding protein [Burkholderiaceae bacterium]